MSLAIDSDTICAIATPPGRGGVGVVRVSGPLAKSIAKTLLHFDPNPRHAHYSSIYDSSNDLIDQGIVIFFPGPNSFTGEDVLELQGHGGSFVLDRLLRETVNCGARLARPGEFSERAFINDKMDLTQAEAIADLIESSSEEAARSAMRTLQGEFSSLINMLGTSITELRVYIEASIDFSEEEIDFLTEGKTTETLQGIIEQTDAILAQAKQGTILREGMSVVIAGKPNAGKSSLLNALAGRDAAIVTDIAGTTRDTLIEQINIDGMPVHITDTAGLRHSEDVVEREGIKRAMKAIASADRILLLVDATKDAVTLETLTTFLTEIGLETLLEERQLERLSIIYNKIDILEQTPCIVRLEDKQHSVVNIKLSAKLQDGLDLLREHLKDCMGFSPSGEGGFIARRRHLDAMLRARSHLVDAQNQLLGSREGELVAEDLKHAHRCLGEITGEFTTDDLLGKIFSSFCVGK
tara:strand:+ start:7915 stop:9315 length:1401 start_codon:yes stop_codon:yes gene_type:complete